MIKTNTSRWYDVQCDAPDCNRMISAEYQQCIGWALPTQAVNAAMEAGWGRREEDGLEHMYCPEHLKSEEHIGYRAECAICGSIEYSKKVATIYDVYADLVKRGWRIRLCGGKPPIKICPDCIKNGHNNV